jgi:hypothetical protein
MPSSQLMEVFIKRCAHHGIRVTWQDDPYDTFMIVMMKMLDYIEAARVGVVLGSDVQPGPSGKIEIIPK